MMMMMIIMMMKKTGQVFGVDNALLDAACVSHSRLTDWDGLGLAK